jgi:hypothetical protein
VSVSLKKAPQWLLDCWAACEKNQAAFARAYPRHDELWSVPEDRRLLRILGPGVYSTRELYRKASRTLGRTEAAVRTRHGILKVIDAHKRAEEG